MLHYNNFDNKKDTNRMKKATNKQSNERTNEILSLLLAGASRGEIVQTASKKWGVTIRQVDTYIARARGLIDENLKEYRAHALAEHIALRRRLRREAYTSGDLRLVLDIVRDEAKLWGLYETDLLNRIEKLEVSVKGYSYDCAIAALAPPPEDDETNE